jgi:2,4-dienoyl-CoA reductase-like NADH-dependent reductase (Old Yellow Enzyme family)
MTTQSSFFNGMVSSDEINYYATRSGGPGMIITGVANVSDLGKGFEGGLSVAHDSMIPGLTRVAAAIHRDGSKAVLQIFHAGRKSNSRILRGHAPQSASAIAAEYPQDSEVPEALSDAEIQQIIEDFAQATRRAIAAGFDGVELHGANTYLLQQFFSPNSNQRTDKWGGDRAARMSFALAVIAAVRSAIKEANPSRPFVMGYRISPEEIESPGIRLADSLFFVNQIRDLVDYVHLSMGSYERTSLNDPSDTEPLLKKFSEATRGHTPLIGIGSVEAANDAQAVLDGGADLVAIGRELIREPRWVQKVAAGDFSSIRTSLSAADMEELVIPSVMREYLVESFGSVMHFASENTAPRETSTSTQYKNTLAPMEGFEKKL